MAGPLADVVTFLRGRGVLEETINLFEEQKIDREVILLMDDAQLANYLPSYGDRIALFGFCRRHMSSSKRKHGLFEKLREKLQLRKENHSGDDVPDSSNKRKPRTKSVRNIEIGWIHTDNGVTKQVRAKQGGGTRKITVNIQAGFEEILKQGKSFFFPEGESSKGLESDLEFDVWDFKQNPFPRDLSIETLYNTVKLPMLRFYIATKSKPVLSDVSDDDLGFNDDISQSELVSADESSSLFTLDRNHHLDLTDEHRVSLQDIIFISEDNLTESSVTRSPFFSVVTDQINVPVNTNYGLTEEVSQADTSDPEIIIGAQQTVNDASLSDTLIYQDDESLQSPLHFPPEITLVLHHSNSFSEMIEAFSDPDIINKTLKVTRILPDNSVEKGTGSGVLRDVYSGFWAEFYERCTLGTTLKVPFLMHDFSGTTWKAIGRILVKGFKDCHYLPIKLAPPFLEEIFLGEVHSDLKTCFLQFVSCQEQEVLKGALEDFSSVDFDDLLEVLDTYRCRKRVTASTLPKILDEMSHKELVQIPKFVIDCWREITQPHMQLSSGELNKMYSDLKPSPKKIVRVLSFPTVMTSKQEEVAQYLKRYVRELNEETLGRFLRFCTGSDLLVSGLINVEFIVQTSFTRRPIGRTCGMVLQLSDSYDQFPDFRSEFNSVLESNIWIMDIV